MDYKSLNIETWKNLDSYGNAISGYKSIWLAERDNIQSPLHIFKDESGKYHFVIEVTSEHDSHEIKNPGINGLNVSLSQYRLENSTVKHVIDLRCNLNSYINEFTQVTKEICHDILINKKSAFGTVNNVISKWMVFWDSQKKMLLSEEEQIGLICELDILNRLCKIDYEKGLSCWVGPFNQRHDFVFLKNSFEVKGTRRETRVHTVNGLDQMKPLQGKSLEFISFLTIQSSSGAAISLPQAIENLYRTLEGHPEAIIKFNNLLIEIGYSPLNNVEYDSFRIELLDGLLFKVNNEFPKMTAASIQTEHIERIASVRYDISLNGLKGEKIEKTNWDKYL